MAFKILLLRKTETDRKDDKYLYEVVEDGQVIATRRSHNDYIACFVFKNGGQLTWPNFFCTNNSMTRRFWREKLNIVYAVAILSGTNITL
jgi:hypothetical protein